MSTHSPIAIHPLIRKLDSICDLSNDARAAVSSLPVRIMELKADQDVVREGDRTSRCFGLLEGFACSFKVTGEGRRQITAFHMAGDIPDLQSLHLEVLDTGVSTLTPCTVAFVQHEHLRDLCAEIPSVTSAFWRATLIDAAIFREWTMNVGQRQAISRTAHVLCELTVRMRAIGLATADTFDLPITQTELADATGMSIVHTNRSVQELRGRKLIAWKDGKLTILDWDELADVGDFDQTYLHLKRSHGSTNQMLPNVNSSR
jgi:CRP-like cAMP-binding protein